MSGITITSLLNKNPTNDCILSSQISEYDIKHAGISAIKYIYGQDSWEYKRLLDMPKEKYTVEIGLMMRNTKGLSQKIDNLMIEWINQFLTSNNIKKQEFVENTRDSVYLTNKIPTKLKFDNFEMVDKEGSFSSFIRINNKYKILYDSLRNIIILKGIDKNIVSKSDFVNKTLKNAVISLEKRINHGYKAAFSSMQIEKHNYLYSNNINIYREVLHENKFCYITEENNVYYSDIYLDDKHMILNKGNNYNEFLLPLIKLVI